MDIDNNRLAHTSFRLFSVLGGLKCLKMQLDSFLGQTFQRHVVGLSICYSLNLIMLLLEFKMQWSAKFLLSPKLVIFVITAVNFSTGFDFLYFATSNKSLLFI